MAWRVGWQAETAATWAVAERQRDEVLGGDCLTFTHLKNGAAQISYWTVPAARGIGVATRAVVGSSEWAQRDIGLHRLELRHSVENDASCRAAVKAGYLADGVLRAAMLHFDGWHDMHVHGRAH